MKRLRSMVRTVKLKNGAIGQERLKGKSARRIMKKIRRQRREQIQG